MQDASRRGEQTGRNAIGLLSIATSTGAHRCVQLRHTSGRSNDIPQCTVARRLSPEGWSGSVGGCRWSSDVILCPVASMKR